MLYQHNKQFFIEQLEILRNLCYNVHSAKNLIEPDITKALTQIVYILEKMIYKMEEE